MDPKYSVIRGLHRTKCMRSCKLSSVAKNHPTWIHSKNSLFSSKESGWNDIWSHNPSIVAKRSQITNHTWLTGSNFGRQDLKIEENHVEYGMQE